MKNKSLDCFVVALLLLAMTIAPAHASRLKVVASFSILGDMVHEVAGDNIELKTLVGPDGDAHTYQPAPDDVKAIAHAKIVFVNGIHHF